MEIRKAIAGKPNNCFLYAMVCKLGLEVRELFLARIPLLYI